MKTARDLKQAFRAVLFQSVDPVTPDELKEWREKHKVSQQGLADELGVDVMTISRWERGTRGIPPFLHLALKTLARSLKRLNRA